jgi:hypothetical protein
VATLKRVCNNPRKIGLIVANSRIYISYFSHRMYNYIGSGSNNLRLYATPSVSKLRCGYFDNADMSNVKCGLNPHGLKFKVFSVKLRYVRVNWCLTFN